MLAMQAIRILSDDVKFGRKKQNLYELSRSQYCKTVT